VQSFIAAQYKGQYASQYQWPRSLKAWICGRSLPWIAGSNPAGACMSVCCECCVLSGRGLCDGPIPHPEEPYLVWCVWVCCRNLNIEA